MLRELAFNVLELLRTLVKATSKRKTTAAIKKEAFLDSLTSLIDTDDLSSLINDKTIQWVTRFFSANEVKEVKKKEAFQNQ